MPDRRCAYCGHNIPSEKRRDSRFCKASCRVGYCRSRSAKPGEIADIRLNPIEAGLLLDAAAPWFGTPYGRRKVGGITPEQRRLTVLARKAAYRLAARGLVRMGHVVRQHLHGDSRLVIERTEIGSSLVARRHNELHAMAQHVGEAVDMAWTELEWMKSPPEQIAETQAMFAEFDEEWRLKREKGEAS